MQASRVIVRAAGDVALVRWASSVGNSVVYITDDKGLSELKAGRQTLRLIGFPEDDVFEFNELVADGDDTKNLCLKQWRPNAQV